MTSVNVTAGTSAGVSGYWRAKESGCFVRVIAQTDIYELASEWVWADITRLLCAWLCWKYVQIRLLAPHATFNSPGEWGGRLMHNNIITLKFDHILWTHPRWTVMLGQCNTIIHVVLTESLLAATALSLKNGSLAFIQHILCCCLLDNNNMMRRKQSLLHRSLSLMSIYTLSHTR